MLLWEKGQERIRGAMAIAYRASFDAGIRVAVLKVGGKALPEPAYVAGLVSAPADAPNRDGVTREQMERQFAELKALYPNAVRDLRKVS